MGLLVAAHLVEGVGVEHAEQSRYAEEGVVVHDHVHQSASQQRGIPGKVDTCVFGPMRVSEFVVPAKSLPPEHNPNLAFISTAPQAPRLSPHRLLWRTVTGLTGQGSTCRSVLVWRVSWRSVLWSERRSGPTRACVHQQCTISTVVPLRLLLILAPEVHCLELVVLTVAQEHGAPRGGPRGLEADKRDGALVSEWASTSDNRACRRSSITIAVFTMAAALSRHLP